MASPSTFIATEATIQFITRSAATTPQSRFRPTDCSRRRSSLTSSLGHHRDAGAEDVGLAGLRPLAVDARDVLDEMAHDVAVARDLIVALADTRIGEAVARPLPARDVEGRESRHGLGALSAARERSEPRQEHLDDPRIARRDVRKARPVVRGRA